jgi:hypothetical protein
MAQEKLTQGQRQATEQILNVLENPGGRLVLLEGLPGTGRHLVLETMTPNIEAKGGVVKTDLYGSLQYGDPKKTWSDMRPHNVVTTGTIRDLQLLEGIARNQYSQTDLVKVHLQAMTLAESLTYTQSLSRGFNGRLTDDQWAESSLGIHAVAQMLSVDADISLPIAERIAGAHLGHELVISRYAAEVNLGSQHFLKFPPSAGVLEAAYDQGRPDRKHIYDNAGPVLQAIFELRGQGVEEVSPLFVSGQSVDSYNKWIKNDVRTSVTIFAPEVPADAFADFKQAFGMDHGRQYPGSGIEEGTRVKAFGDRGRKADVWYREPQGKAYVVGFHEESSGLADEAARYIARLSQGRLPLEQTLSNGESASVLLHSYEDGAGINISRAWAFESWAQQQGVAYFVRSGMGNYTYNPNSAAIQQVSIPW